MTTTTRAQRIANLEAEYAMRTEEYRTAAPSMRPYISQQRMALSVRLRQEREPIAAPTRVDWGTVTIAASCVAAFAVAVAAAAWPT